MADLVWGLDQALVRGQTQDQRFSVFGKRVAALVDKAVVLAGV